MANHDEIMVALGKAFVEFGHFMMEKHRSQEVRRPEADRAITNAWLESVKTISGDGDLFGGDQIHLPGDSKDKDKSFDVFSEKETY